jgi:hypothetical protein
MITPGAGREGEREWRVEKIKDVWGYVWGARSRPEKVDKSNYHEFEEITDIAKNLKQMKPAIAKKPIDNSWYDTLAIKNSLIKKGFSADKILDTVESKEELATRLLHTHFESNASYAIPLYVNAIHGTFVAKNHWTGLYVTTDETRKIKEITHINSMGNSIIKLAGTIKKLTGIYPTDAIIGEAIQYVYLDKYGVLVGNVSDCGPMLVQLFYELANDGKITTHVSGAHKSIELGQKLREEQKYDIVHHVAAAKDIVGVEGVGDALLSGEDSKIDDVV